MFRMEKDPDEDLSQTHVDSDYSARNHSYQSESENQSQGDSLTTPKALRESETIAREISDGNLGGFVGGGSVFRGDASFDSMFRVDGCFSGSISSARGTMIVGADGRLDANVRVAVAIIQGTVTGDIIAAERIELSRGAKLSGNMQAPTLIVEPGAVFDGGCRMTAKTAIEQEAIVETKAVAAQNTATEKPPKIQRKENVLGTAKHESSRLKAGRKGEAPKAATASGR